VKSFLPIANIAAKIAKLGVLLSAVAALPVRSHVPYHDAQGEKLRRNLFE
jgi:hypothetical protein